MFFLFFFTRFKKFPPADTVLHAYLHFEVLTEHEYEYSRGDYLPCCDSGSTQEGRFSVFWHVYCNQIHFPVTFIFSYDVFSLSKWNMLFYRY